MMERLAALVVIATLGFTSIPRIGIASKTTASKTTAPKTAAVKVVGDDPVPPPDPNPEPKPAPIEEPESPFIELPERVEGDVGNFIQVKAKTNGSEVRWFAADKGLNVFPAGSLRDSKTTVVTSMTPGEYRLVAYTALGNEPSDPVTTRIVVTGHAPQPPPQPTPQPVPPPQPPPPPPQPPVVTASQLWIVTIDDAAARTDQIASVLGDTQFWYGLKAQGHKFINLDKRDPQIANYKAQIDANGGIPCVVIMDAATSKWLNKTPADMRLPTTTAGVQQLVSKYTGK
jgi:UDP:flavonoid glycosyltransferase YjiC (YdhE family)